MVSSARLTAGIVAAAAILEQILVQNNVKITAQVSKVGRVEAPILQENSEIEDQDIFDYVRCFDKTGQKMIELLDEVRKSKDSIGSKVEVLISGMPIAIGGQWFDGMESMFASAMMAIPAARGLNFQKDLRQSICMEASTTTDGKKSKETSFKTGKIQMELSLD